MKEYETTRYDDKEEAILKGIIIVCTAAVLGISIWALAFLAKSSNDISNTETEPAVTEPYFEPDMNQNQQPGGWQPAPPPNNNGGYPAPPPPPEWGGNQPPMNQQPMG